MKTTDKPWKKQVESCEKCPWKLHCWRFQHAGQPTGWPTQHWPFHKHFYMWIKNQNKSNMLPTFLLFIIFFLYWTYDRVTNIQMLSLKAHHVLHSFDPNKLTVNITDMSATILAESNQLSAMILAVSPAVSNDPSCLTSCQQWQQLNLTSCQQWG